MSETYRASRSPTLRRIYLDNAATTWPKCPAAVAAAVEYLQNCGATCGRGTYASAIEAERHLSLARERLARLIGADAGRDIAICNSGTHALNAAIWGLLRPGDHVITSGMDHNSLLRPLKNMELNYKVELSIVPSDITGFADPEAGRSAVRPETKLIAIGHASNVTGRIQDLSGWRRLASEAGALLLVDASQTLGYVPIDVGTGGIDLLAAAGHKGLRALHGTGLLYVRPDLQHTLRPLMWGGTGLASELLEAGGDWPHNIEVGNLNMPGVVSLAVAAGELVEFSGELQSRWQFPYEKLLQGLSEIDQVRLVGLDDKAIDSAAGRVPVVSLRLDGWDVHDLANVLDTSFGIEARAGWHCAALVHKPLGTDTEGGTLRLSPGVSTTADDIEGTLAAVRQICGA